MAFLKREEANAFLAEFINIRGECDGEIWWRTKLCLLLSGVLIEADSFKPTLSHQKQFGGLIMQVFVGLRGDFTNHFERPLPAATMSDS